MGIAFWAGRTTSPNSSLAFENTRYRPRAASMPQADRPKTTRGMNSGTAADSQAITNALQLRDIFKNSGGNMVLGANLAEAALGKMNAGELSTLVHDLAQSQAANPGYLFTLEIQTACTRWAEIDPEAAFEFALAAKQKSFRNTAIGSILAGIAKNDPALAMEKLAAIEDGAIRERAKYQLISSIGVSRPDDWIAMMQSDPSLSSRYSVGSFASEWAIDDPAAAARRIMKLPAESRADALGTVAKVWAGKDPREAMAWAQSLDDPAQRNLAMSQVVGGMAANDPKAALASLASMAPEARRQALGSMFETLSDLDFTTALKMGKTLTNPGDRNAALAQLAGVAPFGPTDPFADHFTTPSYHELIEVIPEIPEGELRALALQRLGSRLTQASTEEATGIMERFPSAERQKLWQSMIQQLADSDPAKALEWLPHVSDVQIREQLLRSMNVEADGR